MALPVLFYFVLTDTAGAGVMFEVSNRIFIAGVLSGITIHVVYLETGRIQCLKISCRKLASAGRQTNILWVPGKTV
jgi:hypothetical protein